MAGTGSGVADYPVLVITLIVGATALVIVYISNLLKSSKEENVKNSEEVPKKEKQKDSSSSNLKSSKKKHPEKWVRDTKQSFTHPWLLTSLKGHSGEVMDMDFSSNGKFLATCAEGDDECFVVEDSEELDPGGSEQCSGSEGNKENSSPQPSGKGVLLSRRQKKNRVRRDSRRSEGDKHQAPALCQYVKLNTPDHDLAVFLRHYLLSADQLHSLGYPHESSLYPGRAVIYKDPTTTNNNNNNNNAPNPTNNYPNPLQTSSHFFDVNAQEFIPKQKTHYHPQNVPQKTHYHPQNVPHSMHISNYVDNKVDWSTRQDHENNNIEICNVIHVQPCIQTICTTHGIYKTWGQLEYGFTYVKHTHEHGRQNNLNRKPLSISDEKRCARCHRGFFVTADGEYLTQERCLYHWGKLQKTVGPFPSKDGVMPVHMEYSCCRGKSSTRGCTTGKLHVWNGVGPGFNGPYDGYVRTRVRKTPPPDGNFGVYALDCEMCFTAHGLELTKVTVVAPDGRLVYDCYVLPENFIIDYNTRFSGITARDLGKRATKSLKDVQNDLMGFINADTILIGHGLENDLRALRIMHGTVIDTSVVFPHYYGLPYRRSLKSLVGCFLKRTIQDDSSGHDSVEDARACMELMLWKVRKDFCSCSAQESKT
ncbi:hypothetical protein C0J52_08453 [Blattella germanica]|nr:hypothetical protein C0J52_08453 [Blattella germanica]